MEYCPRCKKMTAEKDLYTKKLICYNAPCYEGFFGEIYEESDMNEAEKKEFKDESDKELTIEEKATNAETWEHINRVQNLLSILITDILHRSLRHDKSKLSQPEVSVFAEYTKKLANSEYGGEEYNKNLEFMNVALVHHYLGNRHHPEHFTTGIDEMNLVDLMEMLCDWRAAVERMKDGDIDKSLEYNKKRFNISDQLYKILKNTIKDYFPAK